MLHPNPSKVSVVALNLCQCGCETMAVADSEGQVIQSFKFDCLILKHFCCSSLTWSLFFISSVLIMIKLPISLIFQGPISKKILQLFIFNLFGSGEHPVHTLLHVLFGVSGLEFNYTSTVIHFFLNKRIIFGMAAMPFLCRDVEYKI